MPKKTIFTPVEISQAIANIPEMSTPVMDTFFPAKNRMNHPWPYLEASEVQHLIKNVPVVSRDSQSYGQPGMKVGMTQIIPMPIKLSRTIGDGRINDLRAMSNQGRVDFLSKEISEMRGNVRLTAEALAAQAITAGAIDYNMMVDGVLEAYKVNYGTTPKPFTVKKKWNESGAGLAVILSDLSKMASEIRKAGGSGTIAFGVDSTTFAVVAEKVLNLTNDNRIAAVRSKSVLTQSPRLPTLTQKSRQTTPLRKRQKSPQKRLLPQPLTPTTSGMRRLTMPTRALPACRCLSNRFRWKTPAGASCLCKASPSRCRI